MLILTQVLQGSIDPLVLHLSPGFMLNVLSHMKLLKFMVFRVLENEFENKKLNLDILTLAPTQNVPLGFYSHPSGRLLIPPGSIL